MTASDDSSPPKTEEVLVTVPEVQLHEVSNGKESLLEWGQLVVSIHSEEGVSGVWLKVGKTQWSIDAGSPTLKAGERAYMFAMDSGRFYSLLLAHGTPEDEAALLEGVLAECSSFEAAGGRMGPQDTEAAVAEVAEEIVDDTDLPFQLQRPQAEKPTASDRIIGGAATVQEKLMQGATWTSQKLLEGSQRLQARTEPATSSKISPEMAARVRLARRAAEKSSRMANRVAGGIADISVRLADSIVAKAGPSHKVSQELQAEQPATRRHAAKEIASAAVIAAVGVYDSMEQAAKLVFLSGGRATSDFIGHKYGAEAGQAARDTTKAAYSVTNTVLTVKQVQKLGVKKVAKRIAKRTAVGLVRAHVGGAQPPPGQQLPHGGQSAQAEVLPASSGSQGAAAGQAAAHTSSAAGVSAPQPLQGSAPAPWEYASPFANK